MNKKILQVSQSTGGVKTYVAQILENTTIQNLDFIVVAPENSYFRKFCTEHNVPFYAVDLHRGINPFSNLFSLIKLINVIKKERPDLIHAHSAKGGFLGRLAGKITNTQVLYTPHAFSYLSFTGFSRMVYYWLEFAVKNCTTRLLAISHSEANRAIFELGYKQKNVRVIPNTVPIVDCSRSYASDAPIKIRMIGRLTYQKNQMLFLQIADQLLKKYPTLQFSILGAGIHDHLAEEIDIFIKSHQLESSVSIEAWDTDEKSRKFLAETDIFVMTSVFEGMSFSLLEAMSLGIPCVVTKVDGNTDVINNNENGFSCLSVDEFYNKIELLINSPSLRMEIGMAGQEYVKANHSLTLGLMRLENLYNEMLQNDSTVKVEPISQQHQLAS